MEKVKVKVTSNGHILVKGIRSIMHSKYHVYTD